VSRIPSTGLHSTLPLRPKTGGQKFQYNCLAILDICFKYTVNTARIISPEIFGVPQNMLDYGSVSHDRLRLLV
jgi:hypothetical protein